MKRFIRILESWAMARFPCAKRGRQLVACLCIIMLPGCAGTSAIHNITSVDGTTMEWPFTNGRPRGASNQAAEVVLSGSLICPGEGRDKRAHICFTYGIMPKAGSIRNVKVFNAAGRVALDPAKTLVTPKGTWGSRSRLVLATPENSPWLHTDGETILVHKFVVEFTDGRETTLHQPTCFSAADKRAFLTEILRINRATAM